MLQCPHLGLVVWKQFEDVPLLPRDAAALFPLRLDPENVSLVGNQLIGRAYGWGEMYDLRDCSAMVRDFFLPFGIWMPRTSVEQISIGPHTELDSLDPEEKRATIARRGMPFLTLLYKPGHVMLYIGTDAKGEPLVFHNMWSVQVKKGGGFEQRAVGESVITTLEPGKELGLPEGDSRLERLTAMATVPDRCRRNGE